MSDYISPKEPVYLDIEILDRLTQEYMSKISGVEIKNIQNSSPEELVNAFRKGFELDEHNFLAINAKDKGILCYDLMICQNPLDDEKLQRFYTFFSLEEIKDIKLKYAQVYEDFLKKDQEKKNQDRSNIDTMLQICYSGDKKKKAEKKKDEKAVKKYNSIKDGFYLYFDDCECKIYTLDTEPSAPPIKSFGLCNSRKSDCESLLKEFTEKMSIKEDDIKQCKRIINNYIEEKTCGTPDDKTSYKDFVDAFLGIENVNNEDKEANKTQREIEKNVYLISLINELAVPGIKSLYFIPLSFPNGNQIGHFVLSTMGNYISDKGYIDKLRVLSFTLMFPLSQMNMSSVYMKKANVEAIKSAISAIMSRNMSHNLGSHYLYYTKNQLVALADKHDKIGPEIRGAAKVMGYMQSRMDYLATIVSGDKYPYGSVFFKGQIFDELTVDDFSKRHFKADKNDPNRQYKRTINYLLQNLILSENFTREPVLDGHSSPLDSNGENKKNKILRLRVLFQGEEFTGDSDDTVADGEETIKLAISKISTAMPGGIMSIHAFYNVLENLIRNSAKYLKEDFKEDLVFTIAIREVGADLEKSLPERYEFVIFDNKANALLPISRQGKSPSFPNVFKGFLGKSEQKIEQKNEQTLLQKMTDELMGIKILKDNNELDKSNKGLKEMFFSTLWMRAYTYEKSKHMSDILAEIECLEGKEKLDEIRTHAFEYVAVDDKGNTENAESSEALNLGIRFELPKFRMMENISADKLTDNLIEKGLNNFTDILCVDKEYKEMAYLKTQFTRVCPHLAQDENSEEEAVTVIKKILSDRFDDFEKYRLCIQGEKECGFDNCDKKKYGIYFESHFADRSRMNDYYYIEAISGENYTKTMQSIFCNGICGGVYVDKSSEYFGLKMKEAALTRITLIDERLYNDMLQNERGWQLQLKNIRVLNLKESAASPKSLISNYFNSPSMTIDKLFDGNKFRDGSDATHFLSIHLGMIEKIVKDDSSWIKSFHLEKANLDERVNRLMSWIKDSFKTSKGEVFVSIHSGRGNYSPDLDASLRRYPFISISAIESVYSNAKFLLAQLFYNTVYIGKGVTNG